MLPKPFGNGVARILPSLLPFLFFFSSSSSSSSSSFFFLLLLLLVVVVEPCAAIHPPSRGPSTSPHPLSSIHGLRRHIHLPELTHPRADRRPHVTLCLRFPWLNLLSEKQQI
ncbi:uncharacterized protein LOC121234740 [Juglans microcarpa x Juglans regia]|uniref:uncharacterized protein LOC121234740 n=1 Tax=Juglans microcarpa x Juglans regia TaxID=2249226 RepID=UPI001B7EBBF6|nr:uncharacterized protein LOC121234740 [Juglans microcarpa x Juglans regia]